MTSAPLCRRADRVRTIPLETVLQAVGAQRCRQDQAKWRTSQGTLSVTATKFFNWSRHCGGGGAIDLVMHLNGLHFQAAVEWLCHRFAGSEGGLPVQGPARPALSLPWPDPGNLPAVKRYLLRERCLPSAHIEPLIQCGRIYADKRANAVFLLLGKNETPVGAELRGTSSRTWRGLAPGSRKDLGFFFTRAPKAHTIVLCESAIDAISCAVLDPSRLCVSTAGVRPRPLWLPPLIRRGYRIYCGFDADPIGDQMAQELMSLHPTVRRLRPPQSDWNEALKAHG